MYNKSYDMELSITENHLKVLSLFTKGFTREYYIREVQKLLNISPRTSQLILADLEKKTVLESKKRGKIRTYKLKHNALAQEFLIFVEQYKKTLFLSHNNLIKEITTKIQPHIKGIAVIFGSYAKGIAKKDSDLDIFIIGEYNKKEINTIEKTYGIDLNIKQYPRNLFEKNIRTDILIKEMIDNHIMIKSIEEFIQVVMECG